MKTIKMFSVFIIFLILISCEYLIDLKYPEFKFVEGFEPRIFCDIDGYAIYNGKIENIGNGKAINCANPSKVNVTAVVVNLYDISGEIFTQQKVGFSSNTIDPNEIAEIMEADSQQIYVNPKVNFASIYSFDYYFIYSVFSDDDD